MQQIDSIINAGSLLGNITAREALQVVQEVNKMLVTTDDSLAGICASHEATISNKSLREVFRHFNAVMPIFTDTVPAHTEKNLVLETVASSRYLL